MIDLKNLKDAVIQGKNDFANAPKGTCTEETYIKYRVAEFIWQTFREIDSSDFVSVMNALQVLTK